MSALQRQVLIGFASVGDGRYRPTTKNRSVLFGLPAGRRQTGGDTGVMWPDCYYERPAANKRYTRFDVRALADPYSPECTVDPGDGADVGAAWFTKDGYTPECAIGLAVAFLSAVTASYDANLLTVWSDSPLLTAVPTSPGVSSFFFDPPRQAPAHFHEDGVGLGIEFNLRAIRGVEVRGGGAGWLPDILVLPILVSLCHEDTAATPAHAERTWSGSAGGAFDLVRDSSPQRR